MSLGYEVRPKTPKYKFEVIVSDKVRDHIARLAWDAGMPSTVYAQRLFDAAFSARCGVSGDVELERAVGVASIDSAAPVAPIAPGSQASVDEESERLAETVCASFGVTLRQIQGMSVSVPVAEARVAAIHAVFRNKPFLTNKQLGDIFSRSSKTMSAIMVRIGLKRNGVR